MAGALMRTPQGSKQRCPDPCLVGRETQTALSPLGFRLALIGLATEE